MIELMDECGNSESHVKRIAGVFVFGDVETIDEMADSEVFCLWLY
ncbi:hypothetical protein J2T58_000559 [Methanocalculus alkaliphilus]|nr:hypothetical protein [Methanocalculus alkaliphilus]MCP1714719.1 hypothetical protein [Methanocalculus alkaliphilus]